MTLFDAALLGVVEGITEFLPISSTGHLILASHLLGLAQTSLLHTFEIAIQLGAILAVVALYWRRLFEVELLKKLAIAFVPTMLIGFLVYPFFKDVLSGNMQVVVWALLVGGIALIAFEYLKREEEGTIESLTYAQCALLGICQAVAIVPGVSRAAATIIGGELLGLSRVAVVEFSFLLAIPTMAAATGYDIYKQADAFSASDILVLGVGFVTAFVVALASIQWLLAFVRTRGFAIFGLYRIVLALFFIAFIV